jgi:NAD(P)-dependent dehydrogenase (short-subunit alcohol dehydrogenase family)
MDLKLRDHRITSNHLIETLAKSESKSSEDGEKDVFVNMRPSSLIKRFASTQEAASLVAYIASPLASATNGATLRVDGGVLRSAF